MSDHNCHDCGHHHDDELDNVIELTGENGEIITAELLDTVKVDEKDYAVLQAIDDEVGEVIIMRLEQDGEEDYLVSIEDEDELEKAFEAFKEAASEEFDFEDDYDDEESSEDDDFE